MLKQSVRPKHEEFDDGFFDHGRCALDDVCLKLAEKFKLYASNGEPRRAFILGTLLNYSCRGCAVKVFAQ